MQNKKGLVYTATMIGGIGFIMAQTVGEIAYWKLYRKDRDLEIQEEKDEIETEMEHKKKMIQF